MHAAKGVTRHHFTVDVEEYFQVSALEPYVERGSWETRVSRLYEGMDRLLALLDGSGARATHFVLGWVAERHPALVKRLAAAGHEVASHGWDHVRVTHQTADQFRASVRRSKVLIEDLTGEPVLGFRAPSFSIVRGREWALDVLVEEGYAYDSSLFPVRRRGYGYAGGRPDPHWIERPAGRLAEFPPATLRRFGGTFPAGGGAYLRLLPPALIHAALRGSGRRGVSATIYTHPWELDSLQPRLRVPWPTRIRHYGGLERTEARLRRLLDTFPFGTVASSLGALEHA